MSKTIEALKAELDVHKKALAESTKKRHSAALQLEDTKELEKIDQLQVKRARKTLDRAVQEQKTRHLEALPRLEKIDFCTSRLKLIWPKLTKGNSFEPWSTLASTTTQYTRHGRLTFDLLTGDITKEKTKSRESDSDSESDEPSMGNIFTVDPKGNSWD